jgi:DNA (cytosine-5)-methyltransferase 1
VRVLDLFCGAGGFSYGFTSLSNGMHLAIDNDPNPLLTFSSNFQDAQILQQDIGMLHTTDIEHRMGSSPDVIIASPPCEEFSLANPRSNASAAERIYGQGTARLLLDTIRIIGDLSPDVFVIENVAALLKAGGREIVLKEFERVGIDNVQFNMIRASKHGNPSRRLRLFISNLPLSLPPRKPPKVIEAIGDLPSLGIDALFDPRWVVNHDLRIVPEKKQKQIARTGRGMAVKHFRAGGDRTIPNWVRLYPDQVATSIIGLSKYIHPYEDRLLTVREHARLMSYPDTFIFKGHIESQYNQVGESVPPIISRLIAEEVQRYLE